MFEDRTYKRTFYNAPQSVTSFVAAFLEPGIIVLTFLLVTLAMDEWIDRPALTLCLLVFALTFPGRNRFRDNLLAAAVDIVSSWIPLIAILWLCGYATGSLHYFENDVLLAWVLITPVLQWLAVWIGRAILKHRAAQPGSRHSAVVVGAGALGYKVARALAESEDRGVDFALKVARALAESEDRGVDFAGYFDDRTDGRVHPDAMPRMLGGLRDVALHVQEHGTREVYITLPLGSQPRIVELLEQLQDSTASLYFVPDVSVANLIQARVDFVNGIPVVGVCESPFYGGRGIARPVVN